ncbi:potassium/sodium hyperpolarization-activated cyclic nucleotide-gated channel 1 [Histomonas meleagridis]|uniref:potassium/sodium hyperpolarization-activated cyclic nucleotide-gated channel 1 n=1 Tax=Histomonas meleagridis TaxID=135588 RepID=UPI00355A8185|nr:potassium/sodium hyperpolarization-activated cyclic nucleotide-gated channel 1 [Histomonas meleagridis]KAH0806427.1 potassium/sodium hyperpolarization-activated cyclic nucleotide-gated channel 1 [Histomonas meleagridis]
MKNTPQKSTPAHWELLTPEDQHGYEMLQKALASPECKNRRNKSNETFIEVLNTIKNYVVRGDEGDIKRSLVCGIVWLESGIAINTHQLSPLIHKCKSSINGSFQSLGYGTIPTGSDSSNELLSTFPFMRANFSELRQWTIRQKITDNQPKAKISQLVLQKLQNTAPPEEDNSTNTNEMTLTEFVRNLLAQKGQRAVLSAPPIPPPKTTTTPPPDIRDDPFTFIGDSSGFNAFDFLDEL